MRTIDAVKGKPIPLTKTDTNETTVVRFNVKSWLDVYPEATITLIHKRKNDVAGRPVGNFVVDPEEKKGYWTVSSADTRDAGYGECELEMNCGTKRAKSPTYITWTEEAVGDSSEEPPEPFESWVDNILEQTQSERAEIAALRAEVEAMGEEIEEFDARTTAMTNAEIDEAMQH